MKKLNLIALILTSLLVISVVSASVSETKRVYVKGSEAGRAVAKGLFGSVHEFKNAHSVEVTPGKLAALKAIPRIEIEEVPVYYINAPPFSVCGDGICDKWESPASCPADCGMVSCSPDNAIPWGIERVNGGSGGSGSVVAVLDTGVDTDHPDLPTPLYCYGTSYGTCEDGHGHGTHTAGTVLARGKIKGVAPEASLIAVKVCSDSGSCYDDDVAAGIYYAVSHGADIISMSFGGPSLSTVEKEALDNASVSGVLLVASAGNCGPEGNPLQCAVLGDNSISYPGAYYKVMAVAATDSSDSIAGFSSRGLSDGDNVIEEREIDVAAPGVSVESTLNDGCYGYASGTSMACPHISGIAAKLWTGNAEETRVLIQSLSFDLPPEGHDTLSGFGIPSAPDCVLDEDCSDGDTCTIDSCILGECVSDPVGCIDGDGCCTPGCEGFDSDCVEDPCGDGYCAGSEQGETCSTCSLDCACLGPSCKHGCCGDRVCGRKETATSCPIDCS